MKTKQPTIFQFLALALAFGIFAVACGSGESKTEPSVKDTTAMEKDTTHLFEHLLVNNKKDPTCGMPVTAGISDTAHYKELVLGFCSKECKEEFQKNPEANLAAASLKK
jgi:YHS domain-containing protein